MGQLDPRSGSVSGHSFCRRLTGGVGSNFFKRNLFWSNLSNYGGSGWIGSHRVSSKYLLVTTGRVGTGLVQYSVGRLGSGRETRSDAQLWASVKICMLCVMYIECNRPT